jgi:cytochrome c5
MKKAIVATAIGALVMISGQSMAADKGEATYKSICFACHQNGVAGAPKVGDKAAWQPRIAQGMAVLHTHAIKGYTGKTGTMPAKGGNTAMPDADVKSAVEYMVKNSK